MSLLRSVPWNWGLRSGLRSQTAGIYRFVARMVCNGGDRSRLLPFRLLSRRSGCVPALPYPPLRYLQSGSHQPRRTMIFHRTAITPLTFCLTGRVHRTQHNMPSDRTRCPNKLGRSSRLVKHRVSLLLKAKVLVKRLG
jgi:hypothetical protein